MRRLQWTGIAIASFLCICSILLPSHLFSAHASNRIPADSTPTTQRQPYIPAEAQEHATVKQQGSLFVVTYFKATTENAATKLATPHRVALSLGCFPDNATWTWSNALKLVQAWIGPKETDSYGPHRNLHVQAFCGPDQHNYHIRYNGIENDDYTWEVYDSTTGETELYEVWTGLGESEAADTAASGFAGAVGEASGADLGEALLSILPEVFAALL